MKLPEPVAYHFTDDPVRWELPGHGFCFKADLPSDAINVMPLFTEAQLREALAQQEAVMRMALEALMETVSTCFSSQSHMQFMRSPEHFCKQAIKALEEQLK